MIEPSVIPAETCDVTCGAARRAASAGRGITVATLNRPAGTTGVHTHTAALARGFAAVGVPCDVQTPFSGGNAWLPVFALRKGLQLLNPGWSLRWYRHWHAEALGGKLHRRLSAHPAAAVIAQCPVSADVALRVRAALGREFPIAMVCHFNFSEATEYRERGELPDEKSFQQMLEFERRVLEEVDQVIYVSQWARRVVEVERGIRVRRSAVIWNGITDAADIPPIERRELNLTPEDLVLINVGTLEARKNQLRLIDVFGEIAKHRPEARLVLAGDGPDRARIAAKVAASGLESKVRILGTRRDVPRLLAAADAYVHYAALENCPVALIEAARAGLPIAAAPGGGAAELLQAFGGISLSIDDPAAAAISLRPLLADAAQRRSAGALARAAFERSFTQQAMIDAYLQAMQIAPALASEEALP